MQFIKRKWLPVWWIALVTMRSFAYLLEAIGLLVRIVSNAEGQFSAGDYVIKFSETMQAKASSSDHGKSRQCREGFTTLHTAVIWTKVLWCTVLLGFFLLLHFRYTRSGLTLLSSSNGFGLKPRIFMDFLWCCYFFLNFWQTEGTHFFTYKRKIYSYELCKLVFNTQHIYFHNFSLFLLT